jgi:hypothetical protein
MIIHKLTNIRILFFAIFLLGSSFSDAALADAIRPALLEIIEQSPGNFEVTWKVPMRGDLVLGLRPVLPEGLTAVGSPNVNTIPGAMVERSSYKSDGQTLTGKTISIDGLSAVLTDVLLQIKLIDEGSYSVILRPGSPSFTIPSLGQESLAKVISQNLKFAFGHLLGSVNHVLLILALALLASGGKIIKLLIAFVIGHAVSLVLIDFGVDGFPTAIAEVFCMVAVILITRNIVLNRQKQFSFVVPVFLIGLFHSLGQATLLTETVAEKPGLLHSLFAFNLGLDLGQILFAGLAIAALIVMQKLRWFQKTRIFAAYAMGITAATIGIGIFTNATMLDNGPQKMAASQIFEMPTTRSANKVPQNSIGPISLQKPKDPATAFLTIEPYEVRLEVLLRVKDLYELKELNKPAENIISIEAQEPLIQNVLMLMEDRVSVMINDKQASAVAQRAQFVSAGSYGIMTRKQKVPERIDEAMIGVMFAYQSEELPRDVIMDWDLFLPTAKEVKATLTDPFDTKQIVLTNATPTLRWQNNLAGFNIPIIKSVPVSLPDIPVVSIILILISITILAVCYRRGGQLILKNMAIICIALAIFFYPFVRFKLEIPGLRSFKPAPKQAVNVVDSLLTNIYRSFDQRDESMIYDRLAKTVSGTKLTEIYLQSRIALELEDRGGARAKVDQVEVHEVRNITRQADDAFAVDAVWTVNGSVIHFGHTHYRQNRYHAIVSILQDGDTWKIYQINLLDEQRLL